MGGSQLQSNKPHKSRFASKSSRHLHKTSNSDKKRASKPGLHNASKGSRSARIQRNKMVRDNKRAEILKGKRALSASNSPPRVIVLFGLSASANVKLLAENIKKILSTSNDDMCMEDMKVDEQRETNINTFFSPTYKLRSTVMVAPHGDLMSCLEMAKVADLIAFVASANTSNEEELCNPFIDSFSNQCLSMFRALGLPSTVVLITDLPTDMKKRQEARKICTTSLSSEFPEDCTFFAAETKEELHKFLWLFKEQRQTVPHWRSLRSYLMAHEVASVNDDSDSLHSTLRLSGYVRAQNLSVNQLVHVSGAGDFQICQIDVLEDPFILRERKQHSESMEFDTGSTDSPKVIKSLFPDASKQEPLVIENVPDPLAGEQTWPTEAELAEADKSSKEKRMKKKSLPQGTSDYQAAWILDETDDENIYSDEEEDNAMVLDEELNGDAEEENHCPSLVALEDDQISLSFSIKTMDEKTEADISMTDEDNLTKEEVEKEIQKLKDAHAEDEEFPDEVDTPLDIAARKHFAKYRGLKSFRTSSWDPKESLPPDYARIFAFDNFSKTQKHVLAKAHRIGEACQNEYATIGSYVCVHIKRVPVSVSSRLCSTSKMLPVVVCGLFQHESKMSVLHFSIQKHESYGNPIKSKEQMTFHVGFRQFNARPVFSSDDLNVDKHKMERFLHPGRFSIASVYAPISFPALPVIMFKSRAGEDCSLVFAGSGSLKSVNPDRIILKKIILTGYPQRVSKSKATVRLMFHNPEDVRWFKPVDLWTKCGRRGRVKEPVGTHGSMKCIFDGVVQQHDTVCMNLYKRVFPKWPERIYA